MPVLMKLSPVTDRVELAVAILAGSEVATMYLKSFDLEAHQGRGEVIMTEDKALAMRFPTIGEAMDTWKRPSKTVPLRTDGRPNRPLTSYTATFEIVEE